MRLSQSNSQRKFYPKAKIPSSQCETQRERNSILKYGRDEVENSWKLHSFSLFSIAFFSSFACISFFGIIAMGRFNLVLFLPSVFTFYRKNHGIPMEMFIFLSRSLALFRSSSLLLWIAKPFKSEMSKMPSKKLSRAEVNARNNVGVHVRNVWCNFFSVCCYLLRCAFLVALTINFGQVAAQIRNMEKCTIAIILSM